MSRISCLLALLVLSVASWGQQIPFYNHKLLNPMVMNPAYTGFNADQINAYFVRGMRFNGFSIGGINDDLTVDGSLPNHFKKDAPDREFGRIGLQIHNYQEGVYKQFSGYVNYAFPIKLGEDKNNNPHHLRLGVAVGGMDSRVNLGDVIAQNPNDPYLATLNGNGATFDMSAGLAYTWSGLQVGVSVPQVTALQLEFTGQTPAYYRVARHYMADAGYKFRMLKDSALTIMPHGLVRFVPGAPIQYDGSLFLSYYPVKQFGMMASGTYKADYSVAINFGFDILRSLKLSYSYEYIIGRIGNYHSGMNHEFMLGYTFNKKKRGKPEVQILEVPVEKNNDSLLNRIQELENQVEKLLHQYLIMLDTAGSAASGENIRSNSLDHLKELSDDDSPSNFYTVAGAYGRKEGAEQILEKTRKSYPDARLVTNKRNDLYYVIVDHSKSFQELYGRIDSVRGLEIEGFDKAWILRYDGPPGSR